MGALYRTSKVKGCPEDKTLKKTTPKAENTSLTTGMFKVIELTREKRSLKALTGLSRDILQILATVDSVSEYLWLSVILCKLFQLLEILQ